MTGLRAASPRPPTGLSGGQAGTARGEAGRSGREAGAGRKRSRPGPSSAGTHLRRSRLPRTMRGQPAGLRSPSRRSSLRGNRTGRLRRDEKWPRSLPAPRHRRTHRAEERCCDDPLRLGQGPRHVFRGRLLHRPRGPNGHNPRRRRRRPSMRMHTPGPARRPKRAAPCLVGGVLQIESCPKVDGCACPVKL